MNAKSLIIAFAVIGTQALNLQSLTDLAQVKADPETELAQAD